MEFFCPKCNYPLRGEPEYCPLCQTKLAYTVTALDGSDVPATSEGKRTVTSSTVSSTTPEAPSGEDKEKKKMKGHVNAYNIVSIIYNLICIAFLAFFFVFPHFLSPEAGTANYDALYINNNATLQAAGITFPAATAFGEIDYVVFLFTKILPAILAASSEPVSIIMGLVPFLMQLLMLLFAAIAILVLVPSLIFNIVNLIRVKPPGYIKRSGVDTFKDPLNPFGLFITMCVFLALDAYVTKLLGFIPNIKFDNTISICMQASFPLIFASLGACIVGMIIRSIFRRPLKPKFKDPRF